MQTASGENGGETARSSSIILLVGHGQNPTLSAENTQAWVAQTTCCLGPKGTRGATSCRSPARRLLLLRNTDNKLSVPPPRTATVKTAQKPTRLLNNDFASTMRARNRCDLARQAGVLSFDLSEFGGCDTQLAGPRTHMSELHHECGVAAIYHLPRPGQEPAVPRAGPRRSLAADAADAAGYPESRPAFGRHDHATTRTATS